MGPNWAPSTSPGGEPTGGLFIPAVFQQMAQPVAPPQGWIQLDDEGNVPPAQP